MPKTFLVRQKVGIRGVWNEDNVAEVALKESIVSCTDSRLKETLAEETGSNDLPLDYTTKDHVTDTCGRSAFEYWSSIKQRLPATPRPTSSTDPHPPYPTSVNNFTKFPTSQLHLDLNNNADTLYSLYSKFCLSPLLTQTTPVWQTPTTNASATDRESMFWRNMYQSRKFGHPPTISFPLFHPCKTQTDISPVKAGWSTDIRLPYILKAPMNSPAMSPLVKQPHSKSEAASTIPIATLSPSIEMINGGFGIKNPLLSSDCNIGKEKSSTGTGYREFRCKICDKGFEFLKLLQRHLKTHTDVKRYLCTFCGKGFNDTFDLKRHTRTHTGVRPYKCEMCDKAFTQRCSLESHCRKIHAIEFKYGYKERRGKIYVCEDCGHVTGNPEEHFVHIKESHPYNPTILRCYDKRHFKFNSDALRK